MISVLDQNQHYYSLATHSQAACMMQDTAPRQPKLRASCDQCGSAKLKCDRRRPSCGRCQQSYLQCVYGINRRTNKKSTYKNTEGATQRSSPEGMGELGPSQDNPQYDYGKQDVDSRLDMDSFLGPLIVPDNTTLDLAHICSTGAMPTIEQFSNLDIDVWDLTATFEKDCETTLLRTLTETKDVSERLHLSTTTSPPHSTSIHDCHRDACLVFESVSHLNVENVGEIQADVRPGATSRPQAPLDHVLRINRAACESLIRLLECPCAISPHLALLYASILSRVLIWYQDAIGCATSTPIIPLSTGKSPPTSLYTRYLSTSSSSSSMNNLADSAFAGHTLDSSESSGSSETCPSSKRNPSIPAWAQEVAPTRIFMGTFEIDDQYVQADMNKYMIASEITRASAVIDAFATRGGNSTDEACLVGEVDSLYRSLSAWLRMQLSKTVDLTKPNLGR